MVHKTHPAATEGGTVVLARRITPAQAARRARAIDAARSLAEEGGYAAVNMTDVARRAGFGRATLYRYFASKDHLLSEVTARWGAEISADLRSHPPRGQSSTERVANVFARVLATAKEHSRLTEAAVAAALSTDPSAAAAYGASAAVVAGYLDSALDDAEIEDRDGVSRALAYVFLSALILMTSGRISAEEAAGELARAARLMIRETPTKHRPRGPLANRTPPS